MGIPNTIPKVECKYFEGLPNVTYAWANKRCKAYLDAYYALDMISRDARQYRSGKGAYTDWSVQELYQHHSQKIKAIQGQLDGLLSLDIQASFQCLTKDLSLYTKVDHPEEAVRLHKNIRHTAFELVRLYLMTYEEARQKGTTVFYHNMPYLYTRQSSLATLEGCTKNTITNHLNRLREIGFVVHYRNRFSAGLELLVNWNIIFGDDEAEKIRLCFRKDLSTAQKLFTSHCEQQKIALISRTAKSSKNGSENPFSVRFDQNLNPLSSSIQNRNKVLKNSSHVDKVNNSEKEATHPKELKEMLPGTQIFFGDERKEGTEKRTAQVNREKEVKKNSAQTKAGCGPAAVGETVQYGRDAKEHKYYMQYAQRFWCYVKAKYYSSKQFTPMDEEHMVHVIARNVFGSFKNDKGWKHEQWLKYYKELVAAADFQYLAVVNHGGYVADPAWYFGEENKKNGWWQNWNRFQNYKRKAKYFRLKGELKRIEYEAAEYRDGKGPNATKTPQEMYVMHENRLRKLRNRDLMNAFKEMVSHQLLYTKRNFDIKAPQV
ncbi:hypothetical protein [Algivirga pacifica]|uniref:Uncharacterized protein n=1 Tax=Algivirga pacifica TaxID=1162670 RepID=A0ABP9DLK5_9BACT